VISISWAYSLLIHLGIIILLLLELEFSITDYPDIDDYIHKNNIIEVNQMIFEDFAIYNDIMSNIDNLSVTTQKTQQDIINNEEPLPDAEFVKEKEEVSHTDNNINYEKILTAHIATIAHGILGNSNKDAENSMVRVKLKLNHEGEIINYKLIQSSNSKVKGWQEFFAQVMKAANPAPKPPSEHLKNGKITYLIPMRVPILIN
jgi:hypothetical protein